MQDIILTNINGDLLIKNGDFVIGESNTQNVKDLINDNVGEWKQYLTAGMGIYNYLNSNITQNEITQKVRIQLNGDGFNTTNIKIDLNNSDSQLKIDVFGVTR